MPNPTTEKPVYGAAHFDKVASKYKDTHASSPMVKIAADLISFAPPITSTSLVLDNASGPGIVTSEILRQSSETGNPAHQIYAADISPGMIAQLQKNNYPSVKADVMDAQGLSYPDEMFTHVFMNMGIFLLPDPEKGAKEMYRVLKPNCVAVVTSIKQVGWVRLFQAAQFAVKPDVEMWQSPISEEWRKKEKVKSVLAEAGFDDKKIDMKMTEASQSSHLMGDFFESMKDTVTGLITKDWSDEDKGNFKMELKRQIEKAIQEPQELEIVVWVAIARK